MDSLRGGIWVNSGSNTTVSVSVSYGIFSIGVTPGKISKTTGQYIASPYIKKPCKLLIHKDIKVTKYKQYRKSTMGTGSKWVFTGYVYTKIPTVNYLSVVKV